MYIYHDNMKPFVFCIHNALLCDSRTEQLIALIFLLPRNYASIYSFPVLSKFS